MAIRLTKNLRRIIAGQFKLGDSMSYLANIYGVSLPRIEQLIRMVLLEQDKTDKPLELDIDHERQD